MLLKTPRFILYLIVRVYISMQATGNRTHGRCRAVYIVKDLVPDLTQFYKQYKSIQPYLQNDNPPEKGETSLLTLLYSTR